MRRSKCLKGMQKEKFEKNSWADFANDESAKVSGIFLIELHG